MHPLTELTSDREMLALRRVAQGLWPCIHDLKKSALAAEVRMQISHRGLTSTKTYFITASCYQKMQILQSDRMASLFIDVLLHYRRQQAYLLHEFVAMPNHFHLLITPSASLERALQFIKGGFSHRAKKELGYVGAIWQPSYYDRRVRDAEEYRRMQEYICHNPVKRGLVARPELYRYSSACPGFALDEVPQRLKPVKISA